MLVNACFTETIGGLTPFKVVLSTQIDPRKSAQQLADGYKKIMAEIEAHYHKLLTTLDDISCHNPDMPIHCYIEHNVENMQNIAEEYGIHIQRIRCFTED